MKIYKADKIFTGEGWSRDHAIVTENGIIDKIVPVSSLEKGNAVEEFPGCFITSAFIDLQIYGAYKKLLAVYPEIDSLNKLREYCRLGGAAYCLPTVATNTTEVFHKSIDAIRDYWKQCGEGILGLHVEGPWIHAAKRGAHIEAFIHSPTLDEAKALLDYGEGVIKMITLAPEVCSRQVIELILSRGVIVSAGHSNATYQQAMEGFGYGVKTATHLYNAMSSLQHRAPGLVGAIFNNENVMCSIIADGYHVDFEAIRIARKVMGDRLFSITDAVTETDEGPYQHHLVGDKYEAAGILSGSALTMVKTVRNLVNHAGFGIEDALRMCSLSPAKAFSKENELGRIKQGYEAKMVVLNEKLDLIKMIS